MVTRDIAITLCHPLLHHILTGDHHGAEVGGGAVSVGDYLVSVLDHTTHIPGHHSSATPCSLIIQSCIRDNQTLQSLPGADTLTRSLVSTDNTLMLDMV